MEVEIIEPLAASSAPVDLTKFRLPDGSLVNLCPLRISLPSPDTILYQIIGSNSRRGSPQSDVKAKAKSDRRVGLSAVSVNRLENYTASHVKEKPPKTKSKDITIGYNFRKRKQQDFGVEWNDSDNEDIFTEDRTESRPPSVPEKHYDSEYKPAHVPERNGKRSSKQSKNWAQAQPKQPIKFLEITRDTEGLFPCYHPECGRKYMEERSVYRHLALAHKTNVCRPPRTQKCDQCSLQFKDNKTLARHFCKPDHPLPSASTLERVVICPSDSNTLLNGGKSGRWGLDSQTSSFICDICGLAYRRKDRLKNHMNVHTQANVYRCRMCKEEFLQKSYLTRHISCRHNNINYRRRSVRFKCQYCPKKFFAKYTCVVHERVHTGEKPYGCPLCEKRFADKNEVKYHVRFHTGEKPYKCHYAKCDKAFARKSHLTQHFSTHTGERNYVCRICQKTFRLPAHRIRHERKIHTYFAKADIVPSKPTKRKSVSVRTAEPKKRLAPVHIKNQDQDEPSKNDSFDVENPDLPPMEGSTESNNIIIEEIIVKEEETLETSEAIPEISTELSVPVGSKTCSICHKKLKRNESRARHEKYFHGYVRESVPDKRAKISTKSTITYSKKKVTESNRSSVLGKITKESQAPLDQMKSEMQEFQIMSVQSLAGADLTPDAEAHDGHNKVGTGLPSNEHSYLIPDDTNSVNPEPYIRLRGRSYNFRERRADTMPYNDSETDDGDYSDGYVGSVQSANSTASSMDEGDDEDLDDIINTNRNRRSSRRTATSVIPGSESPTEIIEGLHKEYQDIHKYYRKEKAGEKKQKSKVNGSRTRTVTVVRRVKLKSRSTRAKVIELKESESTENIIMLEEIIIKDDVMADADTCTKPVLKVETVTKGFESAIPEQAAIVDVLASESEGLENTMGVEVLVPGYVETLTRNCRSPNVSSTIIQPVRLPQPKQYCPYCYKQFETSSILEKHGHDTHMENRMFKCPHLYCLKRFHTILDVKAHQRVSHNLKGV